MNKRDIREALGLRPIINTSGTMTALGASIVVPQAIEAMTAILPQFVGVDELQKKASRVIARLCGSEAGFVTASCAAGITVAIAGAMTGDDLAAVERLPDVAGLKDEVVIMMGHMVNYGAPVDQGVRLAGAKVVTVGETTGARGYQLEGAITERTAAALFVVSHHTVQYGMLSLLQFAEIAHARGVPVIVDAASEYDLQRFISDGADIALYSSHKFLGGPTGGIVAGRKDLVRAAFLQNRGIGRGMKVGKESILGTMAALEAWESRDHAGIRETEMAALNLWQEKLGGRPGVTATIVPDPTDNPLDRLKVSFAPREAHISAWDMADALAAGSTPVIVRDHEIEHGHFYLDPCNLHPGEAAIVAERLVEEIEKARASNEVIETSLSERSSRRFAALRKWPD